MTTVTERRIVREATASGSAAAADADAAPAQPPGILKGSKIRCEGCDAAMAAGGQGSMLEGPAGENGDSSEVRRTVRFSESTVLPPDSPLLPPPPEMITPPPIPTPDSATSDDGGGAGGGVTKFFPSSPPPVPVTIPPPPEEELAVEAVEAV
ncbi:wiskott-Aldrich syndrome protein homolog [Schistocerca serialis cubense]|uniref:wiskott-Aldrich syndrome protein homolog n=1 Tax=Schistocerca serialis cubense TaxID=2023355 RepID=UPI00214E71F3|nr:wiskott-Aldrich syndrome protein homolog [Schistocerca serialis cubense]